MTKSHAPRCDASDPLQSVKYVCLWGTCKKSMSNSCTASDASFRKISPCKIVAGLMCRIRSGRIIGLCSTSPLQRLDGDSAADDAARLAEEAGTGDSHRCRNLVNHVDFMAFYLQQKRAPPQQGNNRERIVHKT